MNKASTENPKRNYALDAWRGGLLMIVLWYHAGPMPEVERARIGVLALVHDAVRQVGWATMDCFFAMSGFLVGGLLFAAYKKHGELGIGRFYVRRGMKIYPAFYLLWALTVVFGERIGVMVTGERMAVEGLFVQNFWRGLWVHTWSLGVEEQFYLILPVVLWAVMRKCQVSSAECRVEDAAARQGAIVDPFRAVPWVYGVTLVGVVAARVWTVMHYPPPGGGAGGDLNLYKQFTPSYLRMDEPMIGVVCAWWYHFHREHLRRTVRRWWWAFVAVGLVGLAAPCVFAIGSAFTLLAGFTVVSVGFAAWMMLMVGGESAGRRAQGADVQGEEPPRSGGPPWVWVRALAFVGIHSYSIYVFHQPVRWAGGAMIRHFAGREPTWWEYAALVFPVAVVVGIGIARVIEMPVLALRDRVVPSKSGEMLGEGAPLSPLRGSGAGAAGDSGLTPTARD